MTAEFPLSFTFMAFSVTGRERNVSFPFWDGRDQFFIQLYLQCHARLLVFSFIFPTSNVSKLFEHLSTKRNFLNLFLLYNVDVFFKLFLHFTSKINARKYFWYLKRWKKNIQNITISLVVLEKTYYKLNEILEKPLLKLLFIIFVFYCFFVYFHFYKNFELKKLFSE